MKKMLIIMLLVVSAFASASTCKLKVYKTSCGFIAPAASYGCMRNLFSGSEFKMVIENLTMSECLKKGTELKEQFWSEEEYSRYKEHQDTDLFDRVKLNYSGDDGTLNSSIKH